MNKPKLGMIGLGDRTTRFYLEKINSKFNSINKGFSTCPLWIKNVNFNDINPHLPNEKEIIEKHIKQWTEDMFAIGVHALIIPNITINKFITKNVHNILIVNPIEETINKLKSKTIDSILLIGSRYTMVSETLKAQFKSNKITLISPTEDQLTICDSIRTKIYDSVQTDKEIKDFQNYILNLSLKSNVVVACTELSIALETISNDNIYDMVSIQIDSFLQQQSSSFKAII